MEKMSDVTLVDDGRRTDGRNVKIELEFWRQNSQLKVTGVERNSQDAPKISSFDKTHQEKAHHTGGKELEKEGWIIEQGKV